MPLTNQVAIPQRQVHIQEQVQKYKRKDKVSARVVDKTKLRIYFPRVPDTVSMIPIISSSLPELSTITASICQDEANFAQGPPLLLFAYSPSLPTSSDPFMEGYGKYSKGSEAAGVGGIMNNDTRL